MEPKISTFLSEHVRAFIEAMQQLDRHLGPHADPKSDQIVEEVASWIRVTSAACAQVEKQLAVTDPRLLKHVQARFRQEIRPWFDKSWFMHRAVTKPRGYPGDYELLAAIYEGVPRSRGLGGYLDRYFLKSTLAEAVQARMRAIRGFLNEELASRRDKVSILNVACGTCREYLEGFNVPPDPEISITCIDTDTEALDYARSHVVPALPPNVTANFVQYNALRTASAVTNLTRFGPLDCVYSVGLCDYIPDKYLVPMLKGWRESVGDGGIVYVAFKDSNLYDKTEYQWFVDWYFFQRTEEDCRRLYEQAGYDMNEMQVTRDATSVIINFIARIKTAVPIRVDTSERLPLPQHVDPLPAPIQNNVTNHH